MSGEEVVDRKTEMISLRKEGFTLSEIGKRFGVSRQRVSIVIGKTGRIIKEKKPKLSKEEKALNRFWSRVDKREDHWVWLASKLPSGYGRFVFEGVQIYAHKFSYAIRRGLSVGDVNKLTIYHTCGRKDCVNPDHLVSSDDPDFNRWGERESIDSILVDPEDFR